MRSLLFVLLLGGLINASSLSLAENIENDVVSINEVKKDVNNYDNASVKTENVISTQDNIEARNINVNDNGNYIKVANADIENKDTYKVDDKAIKAEDEVSKTNNKQETKIIDNNDVNVNETKNEVSNTNYKEETKSSDKHDGKVNTATNIDANQIRIIGVDDNKNNIRPYNVGIDLYFSASKSMFSTITGVDSYNVGNRVYTFGINANFSWKLQSGLHMFSGLGVKYDWFDKYSSGVIGSKMSPSVGLYGMFGIKIIVSKYFAVEPYINFGAIFLGNGRVQYNYSYSYSPYYHSYRYGPRRSMNVVGMMTALGVDFVFFKVLTLGAQIQYNMFSCENFNEALIGLGHDVVSLSQNRWQHHIAIAGKFGLKFDSLYLSM